MHPLVRPEDDLFLRSELDRERKEVGAYLQHALEMVSELSGCAAFISSPRFDQDFITNIKLIGIDDRRVLAAIMTDFGLVRTEVLAIPRKISSFSLRRIEQELRFRLRGLDEPKLSEEEQKLAQHFYNEIFLRHIVGHANFTTTDIITAGFSKLIGYPEFQEAQTLAGSLSLLENEAHMSHLLSECLKENRLKFWIGEDLEGLVPEPIACSVIAMPYYIQGKAVGAMALLGPTRLPYGRLFGLLQRFSSYVSEALTKSVDQFKITFREPKEHLLEETQSRLIEDRRKSK